MAASPPSAPMWAQGAGWRGWDTFPLPPLEGLVAVAADDGQRGETPTAEGWRVETRTYTRKDGRESVYFNYRSRYTVRTENDKRTTLYKSGGILSNGNQESGEAASEEES